MSIFSSLLRAVVKTPIRSDSEKTGSEKEGNRGARSSSLGLMADVVELTPAASMADRPKFLVYVFGHLRGFANISARVQKQWDAFAAGERYFMFLHTWSTIDHNGTVWWRDSLSPELAKVRVRSLLHDPLANGLRATATMIEVQPTAAPELQARDKELCLRGEPCVSGTHRQLDELARVHRMAERHVRRWRARPGGEAWLQQLPVIRTRPDVTLQTTARGERYNHTIRYAKLETSAAKLAREMASQPAGESRSIFGYGGPWKKHGGWGDVVYAAPFAAMGALAATTPESLLEALRMPPREACHAVCSPPPGQMSSANVTGKLQEAYRSGAYRPELVFNHLLDRLGFARRNFRWCNVGVHRAALSASGQLRISHRSPIDLPRSPLISPRISRR